MANDLVEAAAGKRGALFEESPTDSRGKGTDGTLRRKTNWEGR